MACLPMRSMLSRTSRGPRRLQRLGQNHEIEGIIGIIREIGIGIALDHGQALGHAMIHAALRKFDSARVDTGARSNGAARCHRRSRRRARGSSARACGDERKDRWPALEFRRPVLARSWKPWGFRSGGGGRPRARAAPSKKPRAVALNSERPAKRHRGRDRSRFRRRRPRPRPRSTHGRSRARRGRIEPIRIKRNHANRVFCL